MKHYSSQVSWLGCSTGRFPLTQLGYPIHKKYYPCELMYNFNVQFFMYNLMYTVPSDSMFNYGLFQN